MSENLLALFRKTGALLDGHFVLRSGLHSREYFQCAILLQHTDIAERVCKILAEKLRSFDCDSVISPALGGIIVGQEVGRSLGKRHIFTEKEDGKLVLRRGFKIDNGKTFIVVRCCSSRGGPGAGSAPLPRRGWRRGGGGVSDCRSRKKTQSRFCLPFCMFGKKEQKTSPGGPVAVPSRKTPRRKTRKQ